MPLAAQVLIDGPSELVFDYAIPDGLHVEAGHRVRIPLRNRPAIGTVLRVHDPGPLDYDLRPLQALIDTDPLVTPGLLKLAHWMSGYYGTPLEHIMRSLLPEAVRQESHSAKTEKHATISAPPPSREEFDKLAKRAPRQHLILTLLQAAGTTGLPVNKLGETPPHPSNLSPKKASSKSPKPPSTATPTPERNSFPTHPKPSTPNKPKPWKKSTHPSRLKPHPSKNPSSSTASPAPAKPKSTFRPPKPSSTSAKPPSSSSPKSPSPPNRPPLQIPLRQLQPTLRTRQ